MKISTSTFVISDFHFGHKNIVAYESREVDHEEIIVKRWNETVGDADQVFYLGDLTFTGRTKTKHFTDRLKGCKFMLLGNHDHESEQFYRDCGFEVVEPVYKRFAYAGKVYPTLLTHEPVENLPVGWYNIHGHIHRGFHREYDLTERHFNVSCEVLDYIPIRISAILDRWKPLPR